MLKLAPDGEISVVAPSELCVVDAIVGGNEARHSGLDRGIEKHGLSVDDDAAKSGNSGALASLSANARVAPCQSGGDSLLCVVVNHGRPAGTR